MQPVWPVFRASSRFFVFLKLAIWTIFSKMCLDTHGLCTWTTSFRGLINLKPSIEITGNVVVSNPSLFWTTFLLRPAIAIYFIVVLYFAIADGHTDLSDVQSFTKLMSIFTIISYLIYVTLCMIALAVNPNNITYQCALFIIQFTAATAFQCFRQDLFSGDLTPWWWLSVSCHFINSIISTVPFPWSCSMPYVR